MSCLQAIEGEDTENLFICHMTNLLWLLSDKGRCVRFCWIPRHCGIEGNERVDQLAKETLDQDIDPLARVDYTDMKPLVNSYIRNLVQTKWDVAVHGRDLYVMKPTLASSIVSKLTFRHTYLNWKGSPSEKQRVGKKKCWFVFCKVEGGRGVSWGQGECKVRKGPRVLGLHWSGGRVEGAWWETVNDGSRNWRCGWQESATWGGRRAGAGMKGGRRRGHMVAGGEGRRIRTERVCVCVCGGGGGGGGGLATDS